VYYKHVIFVSFRVMRAVAVALPSSNLWQARTLPFDVLQSRRSVK
jgi:hypothetical protein